MARTQIASKTVHDDMSGVTITFTNGEVIKANLADYSAEMQTHLALHGLSQKLGDSYSGESDVNVARTKAEKVHERLTAGDWKAVRESGGSKISDLAKALSAVTGKELAEAVEVISNMEKAEKSGLRKHPKIAAELARIAAARAEEKAEKAAEAGEGEFDLYSL